MKILHLANDYSGSTVYRDLFEALDRHGVEQAVYVALRSDTLINRNVPHFSTDNSRVIYRSILNLYTRLNFYHKIQKVKNDVTQSVHVNEFEIIHAHTWYSDGGVAYELHRIYGIPYIVTIRNTDYNLFLKYMIHLRSYGLDILRSASRIIFISSSFYRNFNASSFFTRNYPSLLKKSQIIPNGIADFWIDNWSEKRAVVSQPLRLLYVGRFTKGKNVSRLIQAIDLLRLRRIDCELSLVGGGGTEHDKVVRSIKDKDYIRFLGKVTDKDQLRSIFRQHDIFVMPSRFETFGLVYIEALSQGLPVVFTAGQAIDGLYDSTIGEAVQWDDVNSIAQGIERIFRNYDSYDFRPYDIVKNHIWKDIAHQYFNIYTTLKK